MRNTARLISVIVVIIASATLLGLSFRQWIGADTVPSGTNGIYVAAPASLSATTSGNYITLRWSAVSGAGSTYEVFQLNQSTGKYYRWRYVQGTSYTFSYPEGKYTFYVAAHKKVGNTYYLSKPSNTIATWFCAPFSPMRASAGRRSPA